MYSTANHIKSRCAFFLEEIISLFSITVIRNFEKQIAVSHAMWLPSQNEVFANRCGLTLYLSFFFTLIRHWCGGLAVQDLNESLSEFNIKGGVYDGIYSAVYIAQPSERIVHLSGNLAFRAVGVQDMRDEKWQPTYDEYTWKDKRKKKFYAAKTESLSNRTAEKLASNYENYFSRIFIFHLHHHLDCFRAQIQTLWNYFTLKDK